MENVWKIPLLGDPALLNMGGPRSRTREEAVRRTVLDRDSGRLKCPKIRIIGFAPDPKVDPVERAYRALATYGLRSPEELREHFPVPPGPKLVAPSLVEPALKWRWIGAARLLEEALLLGLCTRAVYDPRRPVVWTRESLTRRLGWFETGDFYALD